MKKIYTTCIGILNFFIINMFASILLSILYRGNIWLLYNSYHKNKSQWKKKIWNYYMEKHAASISIDAIIASPLILPHGVTGIFITQSANIGKNVVVFQQVTIGANTIKSSKSYGAPTIEDNVYYWQCLYWPQFENRGKRSSSKNNQTQYDCSTDKQNN